MINFEELEDRIKNCSSDKELLILEDEIFELGKKHPDIAESLLGKFGQRLQSLNILRGELVKLEDPEFERHFSVYSNDQIEARYILSMSLMKRIVDFKQRTGRKIYMSFVGSKVFVAISYRRNLFEPRIFKTLLDFEPIRQYFEDLELAIGIVDDLNLNTRIWSKN